MYLQMKNIILLHEIGHAFGLGHIDNRTSIMYPFADSNMNRA